MTRERWWADGWELTDGFARDIEVRDGLLQVPAGSQNAQDAYVTGRHGTLQGLRRTYDRGDIVVQVWLLQSLWAAADAAYETLLRAVGPQHRLVHWEHQLADGSKRETWARLASALQPTALGNVGVRVSLELAIPRAFWRDEATTTDATVAGAALPQTLPLTSKALATAPMQELAFTIAGPISNPTVTVSSDPTISDSFTYVGAVPTGATLTVDSGSWTVSATNMPVPTLDAFSWTGYRLLEVPPAPPAATPTVVLSGTGGGAGTRLTVAGHTEFLAA